MQLPPRPEDDINTRSLEEACELATRATTLLHTSSMWLGLVVTLGRASHAMSESFALAAAAALDNSDKNNPRIRQAVLPRFLELVDLGRTVTSSMAKSSTTLANLLGKNSTSYLAQDVYYANTLVTLNTEFRNIFARLSLLEANLDQIDFARIYEGVTSLRNQHDQNGSAACEIARGVEQILGNTIGILRVLESLVSDLS
jgi:hypothetical protein